MPAPESQHSDDPEQLKREVERLRARLAKLELAELADAATIADMVESSDDAIIGKTLEGVIRSWNKGAERLYGFEAEEIIGHPMTWLLPPDHADEEAGILGRIERGEPVEHFDTTRVRKDGELIHVSLMISPIRDADGNIVGVSHI